MGTDMKIKNTNYWLKRPLADTERDWSYGEENWVKDYVASISHPHRENIIRALGDIAWDSLLEVGCGTGANLIKIREQYPDKTLAGIDVNVDMLNEAQNHLDSNLTKGDVCGLPFEDNTYDVVLCDAVLLYITPKEIGTALSEIDRVANKAIILIERFAESDKIVGYVWGRNYPVLLEAMGYTVESIKITPEIWSSSASWIQYGYIFVAIK